MEYRENIKKIFIKRNGYVPTEEELDKFISSGDYLENNATYSKGEIWTSRLLIIWFIASILSLLILSTLEKAVPLLLIFAHYFVIFGITAALNSKGVKDMSWLFIIGLIFILVVSFGEQFINLNISEGGLGFVVLGGVFTFMGFIMMNLTSGGFASKKFIEIPALICEHFDEDGLTGYVLEYQVNGKVYKTPNNHFSNIDIHPVGTFIDIKVNPDNPEEIIVNNLTKSNKILFGIFIIVGILVLMLGLFMK